MKFYDLPYSTQQKLLEKYSTVNVDYGWWEDDYLLEQNNKYEVPDRMFSWCNFYFDIGQENFIQFRYLRVYDEEKFLLSLGIPKGWHSWLNWNFNNHKDNSTTIEFEIYTYPDQVLDIEDEDKRENVMHSFEEKIEKYFSIAKEEFDSWVDNAFNRLRKQFEYLTSEEMIVDWTENNTDLSQYEEQE